MTVLVTGLVLGGSVAGPLGPADAAPAGATGGPASASAPGERGAVLVTGDRVTVRAGGVAVVSPAATRGAGSVLLNLGIGGRHYQVPATALPYLGRGLDPSLFDVDALLARGDADRTVRITYSGAVPAVPGMTVTSANAGVAEARLTPASARTFGAALTAQYLADRAGGSYGGRGLFDGVRSIALPDAPAPKAAPRLAMYPVTVTGTDAAGAPAEGDPVFVYNVDDSALFGDFFESQSWFAAGEARFSVPAGNYAALAVYLELTATGDVSGVRLVSEPQFAVSGATVVDAPATAATSAVTWVTPRPAQPQEGGFVYRRAPAAGPSFYLDLGTGPGTTVRVAPTADPVTVGELQTYPYQRLTSPTGAPGTPYLYHLQVPAIGTIPTQRYVVRPGDLATVDARYYSDVPTLGARQQAGIFPFEATELVGRGTYPAEFPRARTEYLIGDPSITWFGGMAKTTVDLGGFLAWYGGQYDTARSYRPGQRTTETWNEYPLHPTGAVAIPAANGWDVVAPATRAGDTLRLELTPFSDNEPGHTGFGYYAEDGTEVSGSYRLDRDGVTVASGDPVAEGGFAVRVTAAVDPAPATLRLQVDAHRSGPDYPLSTDTRTVWTWRSAHDDGATLAAPLVCVPTKFTAPDRNCRAEPLLTVDYSVGGLRLDGSAAAGPQRLDLTVGHLQQSAAARVTGARVSYSVDGGTTWRQARVTGRDGHYHATYAVPSNARTVALKVDATDASGGRITESIVRAYRIGA